MNSACLRLSAFALSLTLSACSDSEPSGSQTAADEGAGTAAPASADLPKAKSDADKMMVDYIESYGGLADAFASVTDEASAEAAGEAIGKIAQSMESQTSEWEKLSQDEIQASSARYASHIDDVKQRLSQASMSLVRNPQYAPLLQKAMESMPEFPEAR